MKLNHWLIAIGLGLFVLALCAWTVDGIRWTLRGGPVRRLASA